MALKVSARLDSGEYDSRRVEMGLTFTIGGEVELDPAADWNAQKIAYGRQVVMAVADEVIPQLLTQLGVERTSPPESHIQASSSLDNVSNTYRFKYTGQDIGNFSDSGRPRHERR
jgi:hypothetical protein